MENAVVGRLRGNLAPDTGSHGIKSSSLLVCGLHGVIQLTVNRGSRDIIHIEGLTLVAPIRYGIHHAVIHAVLGLGKGEHIFVLVKEGKHHRHDTQRTDLSRHRSDHCFANANGSADEILGFSRGGHSAVGICHGHLNLRNGLISAEYGHCGDIGKVFPILDHHIEISGFFHCEHALGRDTCHRRIIHRPKQAVGLNGNTTCFCHPNLYRITLADRFGDRVNGQGSHFLGVTSHHCRSKHEYSQNKAYCFSHHARSLTFSTTPR